MTSERRKEQARGYYKKRSDAGKIKEWREVNKERRNEYLKEWAKKNPDKRRAQKLRHLYKMSLEDYDKILRKQDGRCAICQSEKAGVKGRNLLYVDHDHATGLVRGLLCHRCNVTVKNIDHVKKVLLYLELTN